MRTFGIIGRPLGHSFSKSYFERKFAAEGLADCQFLNFPLDSIAELGRVLADHPDLWGFSVTIPYKKEIIPLLDDLSSEARAIGAVNCVKVSGGNGNKRLTGYNTDAHGFRSGLDKLLSGTITETNAGAATKPHALILGTGGASCAVRWVLDQAGIEYRMVSRTPGTGTHLTYDELTPEIIKDHKLIINTTPLGTFPDVEAKPDLPYDAITERHLLYDLVYNPATTAFLSEGAKRGAATLNGETMLHSQAERAWAIWTTEKQP